MAGAIQKIFCALCLLHVAIAFPFTQGMLPEEDDAVSFLQAKVKPHAGEPFWPSGRGKVGHYGVALYLTGPEKLGPSTLAWSWHHPDGRFHTIGYGTAIDAQTNIYFSAADAIRKFSAAGELLWEFKSLPAELPNAASLLNGMVYSSSTKGSVFALNMETGKQVWSTKVCEEIAQDNGFVTANEGVVVAATDGHKGEKNLKVRGLNASTGAELWTFTPEVNVWNFMASFLGDGTTLFQDQSGKAYRLKLRTGELMWKSGGNPGSWTDGTASLGSNNVFYTVHNNLPKAIDPKLPDAPGTLVARNISDGSVLWRVTTPRPPNNAPAVGRLHGKTGLSVVQPIGQQVKQNAPTDVYAYDSETGAVQWVFRGPAQKGALQRGDLEGMQERKDAGVRSLCLPNPWSAPTIDAEGTVYIGNEEGRFYALRDLNGDGVVQGPGEVSSFDTEAAFAGSAGPSLAPGMVAVASCDSLFVFKK